MTEACEETILGYLEKADDAVIEDTYHWSNETSKLDHAAVVGALKSLEADAFVVMEQLSKSFFALSKEGEDIVANGSQEMIVLKALEGAGTLSIAALQGAVGTEVAKIGMGNCMKSKWIKKEKDGSLVPVVKSEEVMDEVQAQLKTLADANFAENSVDKKVRFEDTARMFAISILTLDVSYPWLDATLIR
jgi:phenylalanyl-tRNA synthetase alpha chain